MILVTGATGLVGSHLLHHLYETSRAAGNRTVIKAMYRKKERLQQTRTVFESYGSGHLDPEALFDWVQADILNLPSLEKALHGVTHVYHCAASIESTDFDYIKKNNVTGTEHLVNLCTSLGVKRLCHLSSIAALGDGVGDRTINEDDYFNLDGNNTDYAISKYGAEMEVFRAAQEGLEVVIVNPGVILGEGCWRSGSGRLFSKTFTGNRFYTAGSTGFVDVRDVVRAMQLLMDATVHDKRFIVVGGNRSYKSILQEIAQGMSRKPPTLRIERWALQILATLYGVYNFLGGSRLIDRAQVEAATSQSTYDSSRIKEVVPMTFTPIDDTILRITSFIKKRGGVHS